MEIDALLPRPRTPADYLSLAQNVRTDDEGLRALARCPYSFVWEAIAANPNTPPDVLAQLSGMTSAPFNGNRLLHLVAQHPRADRPALLVVLREVQARLAGRESRPYAAALALASRSEIEVDEVRALAALPGASRRMRRGIRRRLAARVNSQDSAGVG